MGSTQLHFAVTRPYTSQDVTQRRIWSIFFTFIPYPKRVSKEIGNTFNWKTTSYIWLKQLLTMTMSMTMTTVTMNIFYCHAYIEVTCHTNKHSPWKILISNIMREINVTWQTRIEALAYVPQYLLYKADVRRCWEIRKGKKREWRWKKSIVQCVLICILCCLIRKHQSM